MISKLEIQFSEPSDLAAGMKLRNVLIIDLNVSLLSNRCRMTTVHLEKGVFDGFEPLKTLRKYVWL